MKIRGELSPLRRRLLGAISVVTVFSLWFFLTLPFIPVSPEPADQPVEAAPVSSPADSAKPDSSDFGPSNGEADSLPTAAPGAATEGDSLPEGSDLGTTAAAALDENTGDDPDNEPGFKTDEGNFDLYKRAAGEAPTKRAIVPASVLPSPIAVWNALGYLHKEQGLVRSAWGSLKRISIAFFWAALVAIPLGIFMGTFPPIKAWFEPFTGPLRYLPISAVTGIFIVTFGVGESMKIAFLFLGTVVYLLPIVVETVENIDDVYLETAWTLGAKPWQVISKVLIPAAWPGIFEACRVIYGIGWTYVILAELINVDYGLGYLIQLSYKRGNLDQAYALVLVILLLGVGTNEIFRFASKRLFAWRETA